MDLVLILFGALAILLGIIGSVLPFLPGAPLAWIGLLLLQFTDRIEYSTSFLVITALITAAIALLDYLLPIWYAKRSGGTKWGQRGALAGMILGILAGPLGIIIGPLIGAFAGELIHDSRDMGKAQKAAWNSFVGFLLSSGILLGWCFVIPEIWSTAWIS